MEGDIHSILALLEDLAPILEEAIPQIIPTMQSIGYFLIGLVSSLIFAVSWRA